MFILLKLFRFKRRNRRESSYSRNETEKHNLLRWKSIMNIARKQKAPIQSRFNEWPLLLCVVFIYFPLTGDSTHKVTPILTFAHFAMTNRFGWITIIAFFAVVAVAARCCMSTIQAYSTGYTARHLIQFHIETASSRVSIAVTS